MSPILVGPINRRIEVLEADNKENPAVMKDLNALKVLVETIDQPTNQKELILLNITD